MSYIVEKEFEHAGLKCVVTFGDMGHRCGYVGVPKEHSLYGKYYDDYLDIKKSEVEGELKERYFELFIAAMDDDERARIGYVLECHGGVTFSDGGENSTYPIKSDLWWFGFDCAHYCDGRDLKLSLERFPEKSEQINSMIAFDNKFGFTSYAPAKTTDFVEEECRKLAEQLSAWCK